MADFQWLCKECEVIWEKEYDIGKAPKRTRCPECNKLKARFFGELKFSFKDDGNGNRNNGAMDYYSIKQRYKKHAVEGFDRDSGDRFLRNSIKNTKERMDDDNFRYKSAHFNWEKMAKDGKVKKLSPADTNKKIDRAKELTKQAYDIANKQGYKDIGKTKLDITKPLRQS